MHDKEIARAFRNVIESVQLSSQASGFLHELARSFPPVIPVIFEGVPLPDESTNMEAVRQMQVLMKRVELNINPEAVNRFRESAELFAKAADAFHENVARAACAAGYGRILGHRAIPISGEIFE